MKLIVFCILIVAVSCTENSLARRKGHYHGLHGIFYKSGLMSLATFLVIKAKIIIAITVAFTVFILGAKVWATFRYGNMFFNKGCYKHDDGIILPATGHGHEYIVGPPIPIEHGHGDGHGHEAFSSLKPGYAYEKYSSY